MKRVYGLASWFLNAMAVVLLLCSVLLVPQSRALADDGGGGEQLLAGCMVSCDSRSQCLLSGPPCVDGTNYCDQNVDENCEDCHCKPEFANPSHCGCRL